MSYEYLKCQVCGNEAEVESYDNYVCECGANYKYEECLMLDVEPYIKQLAAEKAEIAELVEALSGLKEADMNVLIKGTKHIPTMRARQSALIYAVKTLSKHKGE